MPPEIADSDESDSGSPKAPAYSPIEEIAEPNYAILSDPLDHVDFSQYLSPTQRLSSMIEQQEKTAEPPSTGSTDRFLKEIDEQNNNGLLDSTTSVTDGSMGPTRDETMRKKYKRGFSEIENGTQGTSADEMRGGSGKRSKTYSHTRSQLSESASPLFSEIPDIALDNSHLRNAARPKATSAKADIASTKGYSRESAGLEDKNFQSPHHSVSTTRSSMGGYQGFEMDFRGAGVGMDINANPFGNLSQASIGSEAILSETQPFPVDLGQGDKPSGDLQKNMSVDESLQPDTLMQMATSPIQPSHDVGKSVTKRKMTKVADHSEADASSTANATEHSRHHTSNRHSTDTKANQATSVPAKVDEAAAVVSEPKKRGRKPKSAQTPVQVIQVDDNDIDEITYADTDMPSEERYKPRLSRSRASTVDSAGQTSDNEATGRNKKHKQKKIAEDSKNKEPSSELHLNDPQVIGAPLEVYNPRPSKSRSRRVVDDNPDRDIEATKQQHVASQEHSLPEVNPVELEAQPKSTKKSNKKTKVKRAKTSAAALVSKSQQMLDEDEKDVILMDVQPAKVNMKLPPSLSPVKNEQEPITPDETQERNPATKHFTIDIPPVPKAIEGSEPSKPEPKKRGRKPKKKVEVLPEPEPEPELEPEQAEKEPTPDPASEPSTSNAQPRQPLTEKDTNTITIINNHTPTTKTPQPLSNPKPKPDPEAATPSRSSSSSSFIKPRIGLSRRTAIPSLLRKLDRSKEPPKTHEKKEKLSKKQKELEEKRKLENEVDGLDADEGRSWKERGDEWHVG